MDKRLILAGIPIEIHTAYDSLRDTEGYETGLEPEFSVSVTEEDIALERKKTILEARHEGLPVPNYSPAELENTAIYRKIADRLPDYDAFVFHGSAVAVGDRAFLFTAKSGTGKTTHTRLWLDRIEGSYVVNGDKPILRIIGGKPFVCGTPWMGKERLGRAVNVPLCAICLLGRGEENRIGKVAFKSVYPRLIGQSYRPENGFLLVKTIKTIERIGRDVPIYELFCNMDPEAAEVSYAGMIGE